VTFIFDGEIVETPYKMTADEALDYAIFVIKEYAK